MMTNATARRIVAALERIADALEKASAA